MQGYNAVKRFVARLKARTPARFDILEFASGEDAQVDYGQSALTLYRPGHYRRPLLPRIRKYERFHVPPSREL